VTFHGFKYPTERDRESERDESTSGPVGMGESRMAKDVPPWSGEQRCLSFTPFSRLSFIGP
jgi:hypothetical protein